MQKMKISVADIEQRKQLLGLSDHELAALGCVRQMILPGLDQLIHEFYEKQITNPEISQIIGDIDTLNRLKTAQRQYVLDLFSGCYDSTYVNNRLRIGLVHKRIGVEPRLYLSALHHFKLFIYRLIQTYVQDRALIERVMVTLEKLYTFDITLVVETYVWCLVDEVNQSKAKLLQYADAVGAHAQEMEQLSRIDPLTKLLNVRDLNSILNEVLYRAQQARYPLTVVFIDINDFKILNDQRGHQFGDDVIRVVADAIASCARTQDYCFRYGGDEFLMILPDCTEQDVQHSVLPRIEAHLQTFSPELSLSIGMQQTDAIQGYMEAPKLIRAADRNMYAVKKAYKAQKAQH